MRCVAVCFGVSLDPGWETSGTLDVNDATQTYIDVFKLRVTLLFIIDDILFLTHNSLSVINKLHLMYDFFQSFSWLPNPGTKKTKKTQSYYFFVIFPHLSDAQDKICNSHNCVVYL